MRSLRDAISAFLATPRGRITLEAVVSLVVVIAGFVVVQRLLAPDSGVQPLGPAEFAQGEFLVKFRPGAPAEALRNFHAEQNATEIDSIPQVGVSRRRVPEGFSVGAMVSAYERNPNVLYAEPNFLMRALDAPNDPWFVQNVQWNLTLIGAPAAWDISPGNPATIIAVVDSGVSANHEDLAVKLVPGYNFVDNNTNSADISGHGTIVAGVAASATNNGKGVASLGRDSRIMPLRVINSLGTASYFDIARATIHAADNGAKVVNISLGGPGASPVLQDAMNYAWGRGLVITAAAGNTGTNGIYYPAGSDNVLAVGGTNSDDVKANFSSMGPQLDVVAPGLGIYTTNLAGEYDFYSGTSYASPHVAALAALMFSANPGLTNQQVFNYVTNTAVDLGPAGRDDSYGHGRIDAARALQAAVGGATASPAPTATVTLTTTATPAPPTATLAQATSEAAPPAATSTSAPATATRTATPVPATSTRTATATAAPPTITRTPTATSSASAPRTDTFGGRVDQRRGPAEATHTINVGAAGNLTAGLDWGGRGNLDLYLVGPSGQQVASATGSGKPANIVFAASATGAYTLRVVSVSGAANYTLTATHP